MKTMKRPMDRPEMGPIPVLLAQNHFVEFQNDMLYSSVETVEKP